MSTAAAWGRAFARQAWADFDMWHRLENEREGFGEWKVSECHKYHFLQMACEKLCKAYLCASGTDPHRLQSSHAYIAKPLPPMKSGATNSPMMNPFVRTAARYSRAVSFQILRMVRLLRLGTCNSNEDVMQRWFGDLEAD